MRRSACEGALSINHFKRIHFLAQNVRNLQSVFLCLTTIMSSYIPSIICFGPQTILIDKITLSTCSTITQNF